MQSFCHKNQISVDVKHKLIRHFQVTSEEVHDSKVCLTSCWIRTIPAL